MKVHRELPLSGLPAGVVMDAGEGQLLEGLVFSDKMQDAWLKWTFR